MKKIIILLMSIILLFSVFAMSACESGDTGEAPSSSETSSEEESSSSGKASRNFGGGSSSIDTESNGNGTLPTTSTTSGENGNTSVPEVSFSGDSFYAPETPVPDGTSANAAMLIMQIGFIEVTPSNYETIEATIKEAEDFYATLTPSEKAEVINYQHLVAAREALNKIKAAGSLAKFEQLMSTLPEPNGLKNANVDAVYEAKELYDAHKTYFQENCANFASYESKLNSCYNTVVAAIVEMTFIAQDLDGDGVMEAEALYSGKTYNELLAQKKRPMGSDFFTLLVDDEPGKISISGSYGDPGISYSDKLNTNVALSQYFNFNTITFNAPCAGTLTYYTRKESKKVYVVTQNGETIDTFQSVKDGAQPDANVTRVVEISSSSTVVLSTDSPTTDKGYVYAVKFSYPNLG